jgi:serine protease
MSHSFRNLLAGGPLLLAGWLLAGPLSAAPAPAPRAEGEAVLMLRSSELAREVRDSGTLYLPSLGLSVAAVSALPALEEDPVGLNRIVRLPGLDAATTAKWIAALTHLPEVEWVEIPPARSTFIDPNDPDTDLLWALDKVEAPAAWNLHQCQGTVLLAVVDTGCQRDHPDLAANLYTNIAEQQGQAGVDDDGNGYIDDIQGYDVRDQDNNPGPEPGDISHGTHTSGTAACVTNNNTGVASIGWNPRLLPVRAGHSRSISAGIEGIHFALASGARIISCSWGGDSYSFYEQTVIEGALAAGSLVVAAAGNNGNTVPHYPATYEGVLAVSSLDENDILAPGSTRGHWVELAAPGVDIWSTINGSSYGSKSGTSMATPQVAALCALVASLHPGWSPQQIREQVIFTCDSVDNLNPGAAGLLGRGRINARRSLEESPATIDLVQVDFEDANGNGIPDLGEAIDLDLRLRVDLGSLSGISATLSSTDARLTITDGSSSYGALSAGQSAIGDGFALTIGTDIPTGTRVELVLTITAGGGFVHHESFPLVVAPIHATHDNSNLNLTVSSHAAIGYFDFEENEAVGQGFRWPAAGANHLYVGSLLLAHQPSGTVADVASYLSGHAPDFASVPGSLISLSEVGDEQRISASFNDSPMPVPLGLEVDLLSRTLDRDGLRDAVVLEYQVRNTGDAPLAGVRAGLWMDFDIDGTWANDTGGWDATHALGYATDSGGPFIGLLLLSDEAAGYRHCRWNDWSAGGLQDPELISYLTGGFNQTQGTTADDWQCCLAGPDFALGAGAVRSVVFGLVAGATLEALGQNADELRSWWQETGVDEPPLPRPTGFARVEISPNPFNPATRIDLDLDRGTRVAWTVYDLTGRRLLDSPETLLPAGRHRLPLDLAEAASGVYLLTVFLDGVPRTHRITLLK